MDVEKLERINDQQNKILKTTAPNQGTGLFVAPYLMDFCHIYTTKLSMPSPSLFVNVFPFVG